MPEKILIHVVQRTHTGIGGIRGAGRHSLLTAEQAASLEKQQTQEFKKYIYGNGRSARKMREEAGLELLSTRRREACLHFAKKILKMIDAADGLLKEEPLLMPCLLYTSPSPRDRQKSRMPSSA